jgi:hypothetical protein
MVRPRLVAHVLRQDLSLELSGMARLLIGFPDAVPITYIQPHRREKAYRSNLPPCGLLSSGGFQAKKERKKGHHGN